MDNQIGLFDNKKLDFKDILYLKIKNYLDENKFSYENIEIKENAADISYLLSTQIFFKSMEKKGEKYILLKKHFSKFLEENNIPYKSSKSSVWLKIKYDLFDDNVFKDLMFKIYDSMYSFDDFDCCSRYMECSDNRHCIHPDKSLAFGCTYRKKLEKGIIFYGKNTIIDMNP